MKMRPVSSRLGASVVGVVFVISLGFIGLTPSCLRSPSLEVAKQPEANTEPPSGAAANRDPATDGDSSDTKHAPDHSTQPAPARWLIHSDRQLLLVDVNSWWHDQNQAECAEESLRQIGRLCDTNKDGTTSWAELTDFRGLFPRPSGAETLPPEFVRAYDTDGDDTVDTAELRQLLSRGRLVINGWLAIQIAGRFNQQRESPTFRWLDTDHSGTLDASEIQDAAHRLLGTDADGDGIIWAVDLTPLDRAASFVPNQRSTTLTHVQQYACRIDSSTDWQQLAFDLEQRFSFGAPLTSNDLPRNSALERLSRHGNGNGKITLGELQQLTRIEPDLSVQLRWHPPQVSLNVAERPRKRTRLRMMTNNTTVELSVRPLPSAPAQFTTLDTNNDRMLNRQEFDSRAGQDALTFEAVDRDDNQSVDETEYRSAIEIELLMHRAFVNARIHRSVDPLFAWLDSDQDGRLALRETQAAKDQLETLCDGRQTMDLPDLAASIAIDFSRGPFRDSGAQRPAPPEITQPDPDRPRWFVEMDFDQSGKIDAQEFLGSTASFEAMDANQDGCIELSEIDPETFERVLGIREN